MRISDWSSDVCSSDLLDVPRPEYHLGYRATHRKPDADGRCRRPCGIYRAGQRAVESREPLYPQRADPGFQRGQGQSVRSEEHTSALQLLMRISYAVFCLKKTTIENTNTKTTIIN